MRSSKIKLMIYTFIVLLLMTIIIFIRFVIISHSAAVSQFAEDFAEMPLPAPTDIVCSASSLQSVTKTSSEPNVILFLNFPEPYHIGYNEGFEIFNTCPHQCEVTTNSSRFAEATVVVFYFHTWDEHWFNTSYSPPKKLPGQIWVFFSMESPIYFRNHSIVNPAWHRQFNWTVTYRRDSDFRYNYFKTVRRTFPISLEHKAEQERQWRESFSNKTKMVAWFVGNCETDSKRETYVAELSKHIPVDIYGRCGTLKCLDQKPCYDMLFTDYKFYLLFEKSLCKDNVMERARNILKLHRIVPVARGGVDYHRSFPANSVIDTKDFSSPAELAAHLKMLAYDENAYIQMLKWSWEYEVVIPDGFPFCDLCTRSYQRHPVFCYYENVHAWWSENACHKPADL